MKYYRILNPDGSTHSPAGDNYGMLVNMVNFLNRQYFNKNPDDGRMFVLQEGTIQWEEHITDDLLTLEELQNDQQK